MTNFWSGFTKQAAITNSGAYAMNLFKKSKNIMKPTITKGIEVGKAALAKTKPANPAASTFGNVLRRPAKYVDL